MNVPLKTRPVSSIEVIEMHWRGKIDIKYFHKIIEGIVAKNGRKTGQIKIEKGELV